MNSIQGEFLKACKKIIHYYPEMITNYNRDFEIIFEIQNNDIENI